MTIQTTNTAITYRRMNENDLSAALALSQAVRWPHRLEDWQFTLRLGSGFVAEEGGAVIGTGLYWKQGDRHGSLGMIIVSPEHQGKGIGRELMNLVLEELGKRCTLLIATPAGQPLYERLGFAATGAIHQHQGMMAAVAPVTLAAGESIRLAEPGDIAKIIELANRATGMSRDELLKQLLSMAEGVVLERNGELAGFSIMRRFGRGHAIGPVRCHRQRTCQGTDRVLVERLRWFIRAHRCHGNKRFGHLAHGSGTGSSRYRGGHGT